MKRWTSNLLAFLRDQATATTLAFLALLVAAWGYLSGWFSSLTPAFSAITSWLKQSRSWPIWYGLLLLALFLLLAGLSLWLTMRTRSRGVRANSPSKLHYRQVWRVLWGWPPPPGSYVADGPLCPEHKLALSVHEPNSSLGERHIHFRCPGLEGDKGHIIEGPKPSQLIPGRWTGQKSIFSDVNARLKAEDLSRTVGDAFAQAKPAFAAAPLGPGSGNSYLAARYIDPPAGTPAVLNGIEFELKPDCLVADTNETIRHTTKREDGWTEFELPLSKPVANVTAVHFLINSGNSLQIYDLFTVGDITLHFKDAPPIRTPLILGRNIREWCVGNPGALVRELADRKVSTLAWSGLSKDGRAAIIDCLRIPVFDCMRRNPLERILVARNPAVRAPDTMGVHFTIFAVSLETQRPTN